VKLTPKSKAYFCVNLCKEFVKFVKCEKTILKVPAAVQLVVLCVPVTSASLVWPKSEVNKCMSLGPVEEHRYGMGVNISRIWHGAYWDLKFGALFVCGELWMAELYLGSGVCTV